MKTTRPTLILILLALLLSALSCRFGEQVLSPATAPAQDTPAPGDPAQPSSGGEGEPAATKVSGGAAPGEFVLDFPDHGLDALKSYRQRLDSTINGTFNGQPYAYSETVERVVSGADETELVEAATNGEALYLFTARLGETVYSQSNPEAPCLAAPAADHPAAKNPALKLPPVYGAALNDNETLNGVPAARYTFDARAVPYLAGKNDQAAGELWVAEAEDGGMGGAVLSYELTVQVKEGEFTGERSWRYTLEEGEFAPALPHNCQPLLDLPTPPGAEGVVRQPGFMRYTVAASYEDVRQFYLSALPGEGWEPLPATRMGPDPGAPKDMNVLGFSKASPDGSGLVAVIQLTESGGTITAAVQVARTKAAVTSYDPTASTPGEETDGEDADEEQPSAPEDASAQPKLPDDLPVYAGGKVASQNEAMVMFTTPDAPEKVIEFYAALLEEGGWELAQESNAQGTWMQMWEKGPQRVTLVVSELGPETMVVLSAG